MNFNNEYMLLKKIDFIETTLKDVKNKIDKIYTLSVVKELNNTPNLKNIPCHMISSLKSTKNIVNKNNRKKHVQFECRKKGNCTQISKYPYCKKSSK